MSDILAAPIGLLAAAVLLLGSLWLAGALDRPRKSAGGGTDETPDEQTSRTRLTGSGRRWLTCLTSAHTSDTTSRSGPGRSVKCNVSHGWRSRGAGPSVKCHTWRWRPYRGGRTEP